MFVTPPETLGTRLTDRSESTSPCRRLGDALPASAVWGRPDVAFTPAFWASLLRDRPDLRLRGAHRLTEEFREEVAACLLGGYGCPAEVGLAAFRAVRDAGLLRGPVSAADLFDVLRRPLAVAPGRSARYRFARQRSRFLAEFLSRYAGTPAGLSDPELRDWLTGFRGIGLKTASWIVRNWCDSDDVAILDVHVHRAGLLAGIFHRGDDVRRDYRDMERRFVRLARAIGARTSALDALIWEQMRLAPRLVAKAVEQYDPHRITALRSKIEGEYRCRAEEAAAEGAGSVAIPRATALR